MYDNEYLVKQIALLYLKLSLKTFSVCLLLLERYVFVYSKPIYFGISRPNSSVERNEGGIFSHAPDWKSVFA